MTNVIVWEFEIQRCYYILQLTYSNMAILSLDIPPISKAM